jgi:MFS family permease
MDDRQSHDELQAELRTELERRGLPPAYIARYLAELDDHFTDLLQERNLDMSTARKPDLSVNDLHDRLGHPTQLANCAAEQYHARSFFGRHPILTFLFGPLPLLVMMWVAVWLSAIALALVIVGIGYVMEHAAGIPVLSMDSGGHPWLQAVILTIFSGLILVLPPLVAAWLLCRLAARNALDWRWPTLGCTVLALVAAVFMVSYHLRTLGQDGKLIVGFDLGTSPSWILLTFLPKFVLALGIGLALVWRSQQRYAAAE